MIGEVTFGDSKVIADKIEDGSVDAIICDPVYWNPQDYQWLMYVGKRILKPGGSIVAQTGIEYRFSCELAMMEENKRLGDVFSHRPMIVERFTGGYKQAFNHRALIGYHGYLWWTLSANGDVENEHYHKQSKRIIGDGWLHTLISGSRNKSNHEWGDGTSAFVHIISNLVPEGGLVFDPFTGSGTVPVACRMIGRRFIAVECEKAAYDTARRRLARMQMPLLYYRSGKESEGNATGSTGHKEVQASLL